MPEPSASGNELLILRAIDLAARKHRDQRRKDEEASPYINHPISVSLVLAEIGGITDAEVLSAAILHDTLEDTDTTSEELEAAFDMRIRKLVEEVTDDKRLPKGKKYLFPGIDKKKISEAKLFEIHTVFPSRLFGCKTTVTNLYNFGDHRLCTVRFFRRPRLLELAPEFVRFHLIDPDELVVRHIAAPSLALIR